MCSDVEVGQLWRISTARVETRGNQTDSGGTDEMFSCSLHHRKHTDGVQTLFFNLCTKWGCVVSAMPWPLYPREVTWDPLPVCMSVESPPPGFNPTTV
jgi:hypothetical protein